MISKKLISTGLALSLCVTSLAVPSVSDAAKKPSITKKLTVNVGKSKTLKVKKASKKAKVTWKSTKKKVAKVSKKGSLAAKVKGISTGKCKIKCTVKVGKKKYKLTCAVTVKGNKKTNKATTAPAASNKPVESAAANTSSAPVATTTPAATPVATPSFVTMTPATKPPVTLPQSFKNNYNGIFEHIGTCANYYGYGNKKDQLRDEEPMNFIKDQFNSITLENEMKPDSVLGNNSTVITVAQAKELGYVIPDNYKEEVVPQLNFEPADGALKYCKDNGVQLRGHTLMWHQQTPAWFFRADYNGGKAVVSKEVMDARLEFYVKTCMKHIFDKEKELTGEYGSLCYAWDVVNEYLHHTNQPGSTTWIDVYGEQELRPEYVKKAFQFANQMVEEYNCKDKVTLFYNDYDTYFEVEDLVKFVNFINEGEKTNICQGIGMQSHIDIERPTIDEFKYALETFMNTGLEVQITELDITINFDTDESNGREAKFDYKDEDETWDDQAKFVKDFMHMILNVQKTRNLVTAPKGLTAITIWGLFDKCSWRNKCEPLFFSNGIEMDEAKPAYYSFLEAADEWYN
ncbi:endo-1,4-beta-xylanase [Eubacterium xylanophilum]|uniref:endo-1,4-beta-xylanase n=1 Tax=Eubacterium xylanophilum TaxID=39497 RepID=UPI0004B87C66|nr:endo-1,4-beta-xylanase [Eubacterium xylanophilum]